MTRKNYEQIAKILKESEPSTDLGLRIVVFKMADMFKAENPSFIHEKFYEACGLTTEQFRDLR